MTKIGFKQKNSQKKTLNISQVLVVKPERHSSLDIENWITAISQAYRGRRQKLVELYNNLLMDGVLYEAMDKRVRAITNANLTFQKDGKEIEELWDLIDTPEFEKLLREILLSKFYGKSIVELDFSDGFKVQSIDRRHIDTLHKLILKDTSSDEGIPYEDNDFILNIGDDKDLGIFARTAPYAIFKRNGGADYAQFCELFGIPQLIGKYDPDDENGQKEMEESFRKRGAAADMVLSNKSSVETLQTSQSNGAVHREFLEHWDKQILISAQGQTMTTTDGTSLAQAKVHGNTENDLNKADKIFVRRFLNKELKPRLEKRGYPVAGGFFNFIDEKEDLKAIDKLSVAERVNQLTADGVDDDYFYEEFGLPRGAKSKEREQEKERAETPEEEEIQTDETPKKKPKNKQKNTPKVKKVQAKELSLFDKLKDFFRPSSSIELSLYEELDWQALEKEYKGCCGQVEQAHLSAGFDTEFRQEFIKLMKEMYLQKNKHSLQHKGVVRATFNKLWQGVEAEIKPIINEDLKIENAPFIQKMKDNVWEFSMAKNTADNIALNNALISPNGKVRSWNEFRKEALKIIDRSARYLKTEYNTAVASARMAAKWERFQREKHIYPYAKFFVVQDNHTSDICAPLHGVVVPWDHPLLKTHFPPNHFNCRTDVEAVRYEEPTPNEQIKAPDIPQNFRNNIGITGKIFAENSLYFEKLNEYFTEDEQKVILGELMSEEQAYVEIYRNKQNRSVLKNNINSDISDYPINQYLGRLIVNNDTDLELRIRYHSKIAGERNPEFEAKQLGLTYIGDATNRTNGTKPQNFILNSVQKLHKGEQLGNFDDVFLILNFGGNEKFSARNINRAGARLHESFKKNPKLKFVYLIANKKVEKIDRRDAIASEVDKFRTLLHSLLRD